MKVAYIRASDASGIKDMRPGDEPLTLEIHAERRLPNDRLVMVTESGPVFAVVEGSREEDVWAALKAERDVCTHTFDDAEVQRRFAATDVALMRLTQGVGIK